VIRILFAHHGAVFGGAEHSLFDLVAGLDRKQFAPSALLPEEGELTTALRDIGVEVNVQPLPALRASWPFSWLVESKKLATLLKTNPPGVIHANSFQTLVAVCLAARIANVPMVVHVRDLLHLRRRDRLFFRFAHRAIFNSQATLKAAAQIPTLSQVIYNGIDIEFFTPNGPAGLREELEIPSNAFVLGIVGRLAPQKGLESALEAACLLRDQGIPLTLALIGRAAFDKEVSYAEGLHEMVAQKGLERIVRFVGYRRDAATVYRSLDLLLLPSIREPFGRVIVESMACGIPVVATRCGGPEEIITDGVDGVLIPVNDVKSLAEATTQLLSDPSRRMTMGAKAREKVVNYFSLQSHLFQMQRVFEEVARKKN